MFVLHVIHRRQFIIFLLLFVLQPIYIWWPNFRVIFPIFRDFPQSSSRYFAIESKIQQTKNYFFATAIFAQTWFRAIFEEDALWRPLFVVFAFETDSI